MLMVHVRSIKMMVDNMMRKKENRLKDNQTGKTRQTSYKNPDKYRRRNSSAYDYDQR